MHNDPDTDEYNLGLGSGSAKAIISEFFIFTLVMLKKKFFKFFFRFLFFMRSMRIASDINCNL